MKKFTLLALAFLPTLLFSQAVEWIKTTGDILNDFGTYVQIDSSGNIYTSGIAQGSCDFGVDTVVSVNQFDFVAKYDSNGDNLWATQYNWAGFSPQGYAWFRFFFNDFKVSRQGDVIMAGALSDNSYQWGDLVKFNSSGALTFTYRLPAVSTIDKVEFDTTGNFFISGTYLGAGSFFAKFAGNSQLWNVNLSATTPLFIKVTSDNGFIISGTFTDTLTVSDIYSNNTLLNATAGILGTDRFFAKYTNDGHLVWTHHYNESLNQLDMTIDPVSNSIYYLTEDMSNIYLQGTDSSGTSFLNEQVVNYASAFEDWNPHVFVHYGKVYVVGAGSDFYASTYNATAGAFLLNQYDMSGNLTGQITPVTTNSLSVLAGDVAFFNNSMILTGGVVDTGSWGNQPVLSHGSSDVFVAKMQISNFTSAAGIQTVDISQGVKIFPNPSNGTFSIAFESETNIESEITITDVFGERVYDETFSTGEGSIFHCIKTSNFASGMYIVSLRLGGENYNQKIIIN